ncbi:hypothetical protein [Miltoncostaea oceani]|uniref:hypothetical protein n=1 Tax=Miltoncostaea oceani TaxID=2843216 RepID=UPI001C3E41D8|nr:hypothetical protein [Miltoncostaea oceani]
MMLRDAAPDGHRKARPLADDGEDLPRGQLILALERVEPDGTASRRREVLRRPKAKGRVETKGLGGALEADQLQDALGSDGEKRLDPEGGAAG